uniref:ATP synthase mitochondrial F1 complex assembly factor 2 n=1 Tax=Heterosigma akashiwo TaxID=2829 RepID=A0A6V1NN32_HETAK|mmetsp:Transcript_22267/g.33557  ORF Transcript_22267/g.33557 Transcript_22267/m.33557 type:complete len:289 (+) Transcript_22267:83-949(+)
MFRSILASKTRGIDLVRAQGPFLRSCRSFRASGFHPEKQVLNKVHQTIKGRKRFYNNVSVKRVESGKFEIQLDGRSLKTPGRNSMHFPNEQYALAVAAEWDSQTEKKGIEPGTMPLMTLTATAIDHISVDPSPTLDNILKYFPTDTACYFANEEERILRKRQIKLLDPVIEKLSKTFGVDIATTDAMITKVPHPPESISKMKDIVESLDPFALSALQCATMECKSLVLGLSLTSGLITVEEAQACCRIEEEFQIEVWGEIENGHDLDRVGTAVQLSAASVLMQLKDLA